MGDCDAFSILSASSSFLGQGSDHCQSSPRTQDGEADILPPSQDCESHTGLDGGLSPDNLFMDSASDRDLDGSTFWQVGLNTGGHVNHGFLKEGEQTLIANVVHNLGCIRDSQLKRSFGIALGVDSRGPALGHYSWKIAIAAGLLGLTPQQVGRCCRRVEVNGGVPQPVPLAACPQHLPEESILAEESEPEEPHKDKCAIASVRNTVSTTLAHAVLGQPHQTLCATLHRMRMAGADVHVAGTLDQTYSRTVVALAKICLQNIDCDDFNGCLPGLGISSDVGLMADPVSMGLGVRARHDTLCVICLCLASKHNTSLYTPMHSAPAMPIGSHGGEVMVSLLLKALESHPARWDLATLRSRLAVVCGDGALCEGGPEHRHNSSAACEKLWLKLYPGAGGLPPPDSGGLIPAPMCTIWDPFHRVDLAAWRAIRSVPLAMAVFDISRQLDALFGQSEGVLFFRSVRDVGAHSLRAPGGTRKVGYLSATPGALLENWASIFKALHARAAWCQHGHRHHTLAHLMEISRSLADPAFVVFSCVFSDLLCHGVRPFALQVQGVMEPSVFKRAQQRSMRYFHKAQLLLPRLRGLLRVVCLLRQYSSDADLSNMVHAWQWADLGRAFPTLFAALPMLLSSPASFGGDN